MKDHEKFNRTVYELQKSVSDAYQSLVDFEDSVRSREVFEVVEKSAEKCLRVEIP